MVSKLKFVPKERQNRSVEHKIIHIGVILEIDTTYYAASSGAMALLDIDKLSGKHLLYSNHAMNASYR